MAMSDNASGYGVEAPVDLSHAVAPSAAAPPAAPPTIIPSDRDGMGALMPEPPSVTTDPALWGWRARVRRATFGLIKPGAGRDEVRYRQAEVAVRQHLGGARLVMVANPKGGSAVTTTTLMLAHVFAALRGGSVAAWDNNESRGTLGDRAETGEPQTTVWHLLGAFEQLAGQAGSAGDMSHYLRAQPSRAEVLASDTDPTRVEQVGATECGKVALLMSRHYRMTIMDTGNNVRAMNWRWAAGAAHQLVVPLRWEPDTAQAAAWMLDVLARRRPDLVAGAVVVAGPCSTPPDSQIRQRMLAYFASRCAVVVEVPFDAQLAGGGPVVFSRVGEPTRRSWVAAAAAVADRLAAVRSTRPDQLHRLHDHPPASGDDASAGDGGRPTEQQPGDHGHGGSVSALPVRKAQTR
ncbi:hypothetical protein [Alloactinosynnema sp. L-07]|nr:hypothetical protein [Alloactinosynnema sp. L-07]